MGSKQMNKHSYTALATVLTLTGIVVGDINSAFAEPAAAASVALEEVVVSARRKEENLQKVPVSVIAFTEKDLRKNSISNLQDVGAQSANVMIMPSSNAGASAASIYIRGIGQFDEIVTTDPGVGVYIDGVYFARTTGALLNIGDFQRVEVLRGPQGTLFGKNTNGGAINITTNKPSDKFGGYIDASYGRFDRIEVKGAVNLPIDDTLSARVSVASINADGFGRQANGVETGDKNAQAIRGQLRWTPSSDVDVVLSVDASRIDEHMEPRSAINIDDTGPIVSAFNMLGALFPEFFEGAPNFGPQYLSDDPYFNYATGENTNQLDAWGGSVNISWQINENASLTSITAYRTQDSRSAIDGDQSPAIMIQFNEEIDQYQFSQELQLKGASFDGRLDWVTGVIYFYENADMVTDSFQVPDLRFFIGDTSRHDIHGIRNNSIGVFAEGTYHLTEQFSTTLGARYTYEKKKWSYDLRQHYFGAPLIPPGTETESWNPITPKFGLQFRPNEDVMTYVTVSKGFRSGGFNGRANSNVGLESFDPETVWTYEAGFKSQWLDNTLRLNGAVFYNDYRDLQILLVSASTEGGFDIFTRNAAKAKTQGIELEMLALPVEGLEISGSLGYLDAKIKQSEAPAIPSGNRLQMSPEWSYNLAAQYTLPIESFGNVSFRVDWSHKSKTYFNSENTEALADDFSSLNARLAFLSEKGWELAGFVTNLTNAHNVVGGFDVGAFGYTSLQWGRPREYGVSLRAEF